MRWHIITRVNSITGHQRATVRSTPLYGVQRESDDCLVWGSRGENSLLRSVVSIRSAQVAPYHMFSHSFYRVDGVRSLYTCGLLCTMVIWSWIRYELWQVTEVEKKRRTKQIGESRFLVVHFWFLLYDAHWKIDDTGNLRMEHWKHSRVSLLCCIIISSEDAATQSCQHAIDISSP